MRDGESDKTRYGVHEGMKYMCESMIEGSMLGKV